MLALIFLKTQLTSVVVLDCMLNCSHGLILDRGIPNNFRCSAEQSEACALELSKNFWSWSPITFSLYTSPTPKGKSLEADSSRLSIFKVVLTLI